MSEMRTPRDDLQVTRHNFGQLTEMVRILSEELTAQGFHGPLHDQLIVEWWKITIATASQPDLGELVKAFLPKEED